MSSASLSSLDFASRVVSKTVNQRPDNEKEKSTEILIVSCSRAVKVSSKSKCVGNSPVICAEVSDRTFFPPGITVSDQIDESRADIFDVDNALAYKFTEVRFVLFVPPWRFFD